MLKKFSNKKYYLTDKKVFTIILCYLQLCVFVFLEAEPFFFLFLCPHYYSTTCVYLTPGVIFVYYNYYCSFYAPIIIMLTY